MGMNKLLIIRSKGSLLSLFYSGNGVRRHRVECKGEMLKEKGAVETDTPTLHSTIKLPPCSHVLIVVLSGVG